MNFRISPEYGESLLLAVSGGVDSIVMADLFFHAAASDFRQLKLSVAHCNFHLRGKESDADEEFVKSWASGHGIKVFTADFDTRAFSKENGVSIEMAAREQRYRWFDALCSEYGFKGVCVAHNANDNAETMMLNMLRGTGIKGLCGLREVSRNPYGNSLVFRPLLTMSRAVIQQYASDKAISYRTDSTNLENDCKRNVIRNEIFPLFAAINPSFLQTLNNDAGNIAQASEIVQAYMSEHMSESFKKASISHEAPHYIPKDELQSMPFRRYFLHALLDGYGFSPAVICDFCNMLDAGYTAGRRFFSGKYMLLSASSGVKILERNDSEMTVYAEDGLSVEIVDWDMSKSPVAPAGVLYLDAERVGNALHLRKWRHGDWLRPFGMKGKKKVSDLLTDFKCSLDEKNGVMVVGADGDSHVLAVVGMRIDDSVKITPATRKVYRISKV